MNLRPCTSDPAPTTTWIASRRVCLLRGVEEKAIAEVVSPLREERQVWSQSELDDLEEELCGHGSEQGREST